MNPSNNSTFPYPSVPATEDMNKYAHLLQVIEEMGRDIKPTYANNKNAAERLKKNIHTARILVRECVSELEHKINARICKAQVAFAKLRYLWRKSDTSLKPKEHVSGYITGTRSCGGWAVMHMPDRLPNRVVLSVPGAERGSILGLAEGYERGYKTFGCCQCDSSFRIGTACRAAMPPEGSTRTEIVLGCSSPDGKARCRGRVRTTDLPYRTPKQRKLSDRIVSIHESAQNIPECHQVPLSVAASRCAFQVHAKHAHSVWPLTNSWTPNSKKCKRTCLSNVCLMIYGTVALLEARRLTPVYKCIHPKHIPTPGKTECQRRTGSLCHSERPNKQKTKPLARKSIKDQNGSLISSKGRLDC
ncbi:hypothetical protein T265_15142 [Opisthorchis viverrini]|uniref:Cyclin-dependent kinase 2-associated protein 2 n=1 Tax=Opisthorchis viverrini TaxID=6198 RepID=A0A074Z2H3_OPIVI|nr:hypothetical protein T265_15142 [Opisthorchis viverrini]KER21256.1 hypothetical protein T265_15142 [Opisthorchis viverrini]